MGRIARGVLPGVPHHVTQRGVRSMDVVRDDNDVAYLQSRYPDAIYQELLLLQQTVFLSGM